MMRIALAITLLFVAATSALGGVRSVRLATATSRQSQYLGALIAFAMMLWCAYLCYWILSQ